MAFHFRYQRILDIRELEEDQEKTRFAEIQQQLSAEKGKLRRDKQELQNILSSEGQKRKKVTDVSNFLQLQRYAKLLENRISRQQKVVDSWQKKLDKQRQKLIEASQQRQVMEKLKENDYEEFQKEMLKEEERQNNEIANQQFFRDARRNA
ncbi:MAG: flagellar export protein FliJ [bacterium]